MSIEAIVSTTTNFNNQETQQPEPSLAEQRIEQFYAAKEHREQTQTLEARHYTLTMGLIQLGEIITTGSSEELLAQRALLMAEREELAHEIARRREQALIQTAQGRQTTGAIRWDHIDTREVERHVVNGGEDPAELLALSPEDETDGHRYLKIAAL